MPKQGCQKSSRQKSQWWRWYKCLPLVTAIILMWISVAAAQSPNSVTSDVNQNTQWTLLTGCLVFFMNAGFTMLETGFCRSSSTITVLAKNLIVFAIATSAFWILGFGFMFGDGNPFIGTNGFLLIGSDNSPLIEDNYQGIFHSLSWANIPLNAKFFFQLTFAGAAATIVSGAVAERIKFSAFVTFSFFFVLSYSITGHWVWGDGFLSKLGFRDFAGSTVVHSVGGWAALMGTLFLKQRLGKYRNFAYQERRIAKQTSYYGKKIVSMKPYNLSIATLGCFILWLGWFGFNAGSTLTADAEAISHILLATLMAGAMGGISATFTAWQFYEKPSLSFIINGILAGCVSITAPCAFVSIPSAALIGLCGGFIVVFATIILDKCQIDDPVGAVPVHLCCGIWGTLAVGLFSQNPGSYPWYNSVTCPNKAGLFFNLNEGIEQLFAQIIGIITVGGFTVIFSTLIWLGVSYFICIISPEVKPPYTPLKGLRVSRKEEILGVDNLFTEGEDIMSLKRKRRRR
ncbi:ammonium transporter [Limnofasciculus baicalensis]|uniref:Ammonium transporter n=1 Tax=Limnofasciculus baicalensis BBK-W-15 TaxID=2699891 RepID=A0AAE3KN19_9CYAN|nr:ammonium transporter [Limnofasciculus baicalensis]MCP2730080.1 ammonium transporter [Limnofasciculus baicalensis BBK-W-15]